MAAPSGLSSGSSLDFPTNPIFLSRLFKLASSEDFLGASLDELGVYLSESCLTTFE